MSRFNQEFEKKLKQALYNKVYDLECNIFRLKEELDYLKEYLQPFHPKPEIFQTRSQHYFLIELVNDTKVLRESINHIKDAPFEDTMPLIRYSYFGDNRQSIS